MIIEVKVPDDWSPGLTLALAQLLRKTLTQGFPVVVAVRQDITDEELSDAFAKAREAIADAGLAA